MAEKQEEIAQQLAKETGVAQEDVSKVLDALRLSDTLAGVEAGPLDVGSTVSRENLVVGVRLAKGLSQV